MPAVGHKAAFASLRQVLVVVASKGRHDRPAGAVHGVAAAALWQGRVLTVGRSAAAALPVEAPLASRCAFVLAALQSGEVWLTDCSRHGTLVLELPSGTTITPGSITKEQLDALPWAEASMLGEQESVQLGVGRPTLLAVGLHRESWLAGAKQGMSSELEVKGAVLLCYEQQGMPHCTTSNAEGEQPAAVMGPPPELAAVLGRMPFAHSPHRHAQAAPLSAARLMERNDHSVRHARIRYKHGSEREKSEGLQPLAQAFNIHQWAAAVWMRQEGASRAVVHTDADEKEKSRKRVRFSKDVGEAEAKNPKLAAKAATARAGSRAAAEAAPGAGKEGGQHPKPAADVGAARPGRRVAADAATSASNEDGQHPKPVADVGAAHAGRRVAAEPAAGAGKEGGQHSKPSAEVGAARAGRRVAADAEAGAGRTSEKEAAGKAGAHSRSRRHTASAAVAAETENRDVGNAAAPEAHQRSKGAGGSKPLMKRGGHIVRRLLGGGKKKQQKQTHETREK